ncbi:MAG: 5-(carboxyamino)imidazole ribonucleotide synthase [Balneolaceae bacterium]
MKNSIASDFRLGFLGAGQLARMSSLEAFRLGIRIAVYSDRPENEPVQFMTPYSYTGSFDDVDSMVKFASSCDLITLENEFIDSSILKIVRDQSETEIFPAPESFCLIENKLSEKQTFEQAGIPVTPYTLIRNSEDLDAFGSAHGWPYLLKSSKGGYDGYGNITVIDLEDAEKAFEQLGGNAGHDIIAEAFVTFTHELAVQVARNETGSAVYPCVETVQKKHICVAVKAPAPVHADIQKRAQNLALKATEAINGKGIFAFEFFLKKNGDLILNESAPRPHNSGHYTIEGCVTSQFENHIRAVLGLPLGNTELRRPAAVMINLLGTHNRKAVAEHIYKIFRTNDAHLHLYGKNQSRDGRKMGHVTILGDDISETYRNALDITEMIEI